MKKIADIFMQSGGPVRPMERYTGWRRYPTHQQIALLAYSLYQLRGRHDGHHVEDWLRAEEELQRHYA